MIFIFDFVTCTKVTYPFVARNQAAILFFFFSFFMLIRRDSNPSPLCLPVNYQFNAYANCAIPAWLQIQWFFGMLFICKWNSCPWLAVENNDIMNLRPRGPWGPTRPRTKTNQSLPNIMETVAFSALRKFLFNQDSCIFLTTRTFKKALSAFTFFRRAILILAGSFV